MNKKYFLIVGHYLYLYSLIGRPHTVCYWNINMMGENTLTKYSVFYFTLYFLPFFSNHKYIN